MAATAKIKAVITAEDKASDTLKGFGGNVTDVAKKAAVGLTVAGAALTYFAKEATEFTTDYVKGAREISRETGVSISEASRLTYVTQKLGVSSEEASAIFGIFSKRIKSSTEETAAGKVEQAGLAEKIEKTKLEIRGVTRELDDNTKEIKKNGDKSGDLKFKSEELKFKLKELNGEVAGLTAKMGEAKSPFDKLGIATRDASGNMRGFTDILFDTADKFQKMPDGIEKTALAMELFGRSGKDMLPVLNQGSAGIKNLQLEADKLGVTLSDKTIGSISRLVESQKLLKTSTDSLKIAVGEATAPVLTAFNTKISEVLQNLLNSDPATRTLTASILAFGGPVLSGTGILVGFAANITTVIANMIAMKAATDASTASTGVLRASLLIPMIMPAIAVAAAIAALGFVIAKAIETRNVVEESKRNILASTQASIDAMQRMATMAATGNARAQAYFKSQGIHSAPVPGTPGFASGTNFAPGGMAMVGERGPELVNLPRGSKVTPNNRIGGNVNININAGAFMGTRQDARKYAEMIMNAYKDLQSARGMA